MLDYSELKLQKYLETDEINTKHKTLLFKIRTRMVQTSNNFGTKALCPLCLTEEDVQDHVIDCIIVKIRCPEVVTTESMCINDALQNDVKKMHKFAVIFELAWRTREEILFEKTALNTS